MFNIEGDLSCFEIESKAESFPWLECVQELTCDFYT